MDSLSLSRHPFFFFFGNLHLRKSRVDCTWRIVQSLSKENIDSSLHSISQLQLHPISCAVNDSRSVENWTESLSVK